MNKSKVPKYYFVASGNRLSKNYEFLHEAKEELSYAINEELRKESQDQRAVVLYCSSDVNSDFSINTVDTWYPGDTLE